MLHDILTGDIFSFMILFARMGAAFMVFPGFSSNIINVRARLILALSMAFLLLPVLHSKLPPMSATPIDMVLLLFREITVGAFIGLVPQVLLSAMDLAGNSIGYAVGLTNMFTFDPVTEQQSQLMTGFLNLVAITIIFISNTHHLMLRALVDSYDLFVPGQPIDFGDMSHHLVQIVGEACVMGFRLASPLLVFSLAFNTGLGLMNKLVPQIPVFFVGLPIQIMGGLSVLALSLPAIIYVLMRFLENGLSPFIGGE